MTKHEKNESGHWTACRIEEMWECLRLAETWECYIRIIKDMYDGATTTVRCAAGLTDEFEVGVRLHQGSALSPFLFAIIMGKLTKTLGRKHYEM